MNPTVINLLWGLLFTVVNFTLVLLAYNLFGKIGMFVWIAIATIIANIQVTKTIDLFGFAATLGNVFYGSIFLSTDILNEKYGKREANRSVLLGFFSNLVLIISMQMALFFVPMEGFEGIQDSLSNIFGLVPRICLASLLAYLASQFLDILIFNKIKAKSKDKYVWLRNNVATMLSQIVDTAIFVTVSFLGVYEAEVLLSIFLSTYILKLLVALLDTPFLYISKKIKPGILIGESSSKYVDKIISIKDRFVKKLSGKKNTDDSSNDQSSDQENDSDNKQS